MKEVWAVGIRRITVIFLAFLAVVLSIMNAYAAVEILSYEQLMDLDEPSTVYVEGKTSDPYPVHMKETLMDSSKWPWMIKDGNGAYRASGHYVTMTEYQAMSISTRGLILNHRDCTLEIQVNGPGQWSVIHIRVADQPITFNGLFWPILFLIIAFGIAVLLIIRNFNLPVSEKQPRQWEPGKLLLTAFFLTELFKNDRKK